MVNTAFYTTALAVLLIIIVSRLWGSRHAESRWHNKMERKGMRWLPISSARRMEGLLDDGWARTTWGLPFYRKETVFEHGDVWEVKIPCIKITYTARGRRPLLELVAGIYSSEAYDTIEGVTLQEQDDGTYTIEPASSEHELLQKSSEREDV